MIWITIRIQISGQTRQCSYINGNGGCRAGRAGYRVDIAFDAAFENRDGRGPAVDRAVGDSDRQHDLKGCAGVCFGLELTVRNLLQ